MERLFYYIVDPKGTEGEALDQVRYELSLMCHDCPLWEKGLPLADYQGNKEKFILLPSAHMNMKELKPIYRADSPEGLLLISIQWVWFAKKMVEAQFSVEEIEVLPECHILYRTVEVGSRWHVSDGGYIVPIILKNRD